MKFKRCDIVARNPLQIGAFEVVVGRFKMLARFDNHGRVSPEPEVDDVRVDGDQKALWNPGLFVRLAYEDSILGPQPVLRRV